MIILKLGGSVVTDKSKPLSLRKKIVERLAQEIKDSKKKVLVVHGGGSYGHPLALRYELQEGLKSSEQLIGVAETRAAMAELNQKIVETFVGKGIPAVSIQTSAVFECENKRIAAAHIDIVRDFLELGIIPLLYGDVVVDKALKVCILSGDQIVTYLAKHLQPERVILATDVEGVRDKNGKVIEVVNNQNAASVLDAVGTSTGDDVTGGMRGKVEELLGLLEEGVSSMTVNALEEGRVKNALLGKRTKGTVFEVKG
jgi:isopentenyl phosphate kinase